jgi:negative regulator of flagellin synthesis FlgM
LNNIQSSIVGAPVVDANKVAQIKQAMSEGHFKVNSGVVADSLIETVRKLIRNGA